jgi:hypothetical protein
MTLETETSGALMTFGAIRRYLETSFAEVCFGAIHPIRLWPDTD